MSVLPERDIAWNSRRCKVADKERGIHATYTYLPLRCAPPRCSVQASVQVESCSLSITQNILKPSPAARAIKSVITSTSSRICYKLRPEREGNTLLVKVPSDILLGWTGMRKSTFVRYGNGEKTYLG